MVMPPMAMASLVRQRIPVTGPKNSENIWARYSTSAYRKVKKYAVVMFKSCFPASNIESQEQLREYQQYFNKIAESFQKQKDVVFIACTAPPLVPNESNGQNAKRARRFNNWLKNEWAPKLKNVEVFDFYGVLADNSGFLLKSYRQDEYDSHPATLGNKAATKKFVSFIKKLKTKHSL